MDALRPQATFLQPRPLEEEKKMVELTEGWGFCQTDSVDGQWDRDEGDVGPMASTLGGEEVRTARTVGKSGQVQSLQVSGQGRRVERELGPKGERLGLSFGRWRYWATCSQGGQGTSPNREGAGSRVPSGCSQLLCGSIRHEGRT